jgi:hypothetical protein
MGGTVWLVEKPRSVGGTVWLVEGGGWHRLAGMQTARRSGPATFVGCVNSNLLAIESPTA